MPEVALSEVSGLPINRLLVQTGLVSSNSEARRLLGQGAVELIRTDGERTTAAMGDEPSLNPGDVVRAGRRRFVRLIP